MVVCHLLITLADEFCALFTEKWIRPTQFVMNRLNMSHIHAWLRLKATWNCHTHFAKNGRSKTCDCAFQEVQVFCLQVTRYTSTYNVLRQPAKNNFSKTRFKVRLRVYLKRSYYAFWKENGGRSKSCLGAVLTVIFSIFIEQWENRFHRKTDIGNCTWSCHTFFAYNMAVSQKPASVRLWTWFLFAFHMKAFALCRTCVRRL